MNVVYAFVEIFFHLPVLLTALSFFPSQEESELTFYVVIPP